jgi:hypothetical protein
MTAGTPTITSYTTKRDLTRIRRAAIFKVVCQKICQKSTVWQGRSVVALDPSCRRANTASKLGFRRGGCAARVIVCKG